MNLYKVMLVDDEEEVREAIKRRVNWEEIGFEVVASAENGEDALEKAKIYTPDVVMSDIHMPFMDGLTFCKTLKSEQPGTKFIIFSGYDEFEYAKEAIRLEAEEYILKPIDAEELKRVFARIKTRLDEDYDKRRNFEILQKYYNESLPVLKEQLLIGILEGRVVDASINRYVIEYGFDVAPFYCVGVIEPSLTGDESPAIGQMLAISLKQIVDEQMSKTMDYYSINYLGRVIVIARMTSTAGYKKFVDIVDQICKLASRMMDVPTSAGISRVVGMLKDLARAFKEANDALSYKIMFDDNQALAIQDVEPGFTSYAEFDENKINMLLKEIKIGTKEDLSKAINDMIGSYKKSTISINQLRLYLVEMYVSLMRLAGSYNLSNEQMAELDRDVYSETRSFNSLDEIKDWLEQICLQLRGFIRKERQDSTKLLVEKAKEYINEKFTDSGLSVDTICSYLGVSPTYFSSMFKKDTGVSFVTYITNIRMERAVHLLESTSEKSYVIAGMVGYEDPNYFSYVFKKAYGVSPSKYRNNQETAI